MTSNTNDMKTISLLFIIYLFIYGVFGDETERVSVNDGGSVTLHTRLTELQRVDVIVWRFKGDRIAKINREFSIDPVYGPDERFTDRLKMNPQTGDLTITNITSQHSGLYQLEIDGVISPKAFNINITEGRERYSRDGDDEDVSSSKGPSSGVKAGICVVPLLLVIAAVVGVVIYRHRKMRHRDSRDEEESAEMQKRNGDASNGDVHPE